MAKPQRPINLYVAHRRMALLGLLLLGACAGPWPAMKMLGLRRLGRFNRGCRVTAITAPPEWQGGGSARWVRWRWGLRVGARGSSPTTPPSSA